MEDEHFPPRLWVRLCVNLGNIWGNNCAQICLLVTKKASGKSLKSLLFS